MRKELRYLIRGQHDGKGLRDLRTDVDRTAKHVKGRFAAVGTALKAGIAGGVAGGLAAGLANPFQATADAIEQLDKIAKRARTSGLASGFYQTLAVAASEASVAQGVLDSSLTAFVKRMGEMQSGTGPLVSTLSKLDGELLSMLQRASGQEQALRIAADRMATYNDQSKAAAVSAALFSRAGVDLSRVLVQGSQVFDSTGNRARALGLILDQELLDKAEALQNEYGNVSDAMDKQFKATLVAIAPFVIEGSRVIGDMAKELRELADAGAAASNEIDESWFTKMDKFVRKHGPFSPGGGASGRAGRSTNTAIRQGWENYLAMTQSIDPSWHPLHISNSTAKGDLGQINVSQRSNSASKSNFGVPALQGGGRTAPFYVPGSAVRSKPQMIDDLGGKLADLRDPMNLLTEDFDQLKESTNNWSETVISGLSGIGSGIAGVIKGTETLNDLLARTADRITSMLADKAFSELLGSLLQIGWQSPAEIDLASRLGGANHGFMGLYAAGGTLGAGQWGIAGEAGPEVVEGPARITPMSGYDRSPANFNSTTVVHISGGMGDEQVRRLRAELDARDQANRRKFGQMFVDTRSRGGI